MLVIGEGGDDEESEVWKPLHVEVYLERVLLAPIG